MAELRVSPGRLTMHFEVELGFEVRSGRWRPRALAQQQCGGFLGQAAPARILHHPAFYHPGSRRDGGHQGWGRGARVRGRPAPSIRRVMGSPLSASPLFLGKESRGSLTQSHREQREGLHGAAICSAPKPPLLPFTFTFLQRPAGEAEEVPSVVG